MASRSLKVLFFLILQHFECIASSSVEDFTNVAVARLVTFASDTVKIKTEIEVQNNGKVVAKSYEYHINPDVEIYDIAFMDKFENQINFTKNTSGKTFVVQFPVQLKHLERTSIIVKETHVNKIKPRFKTRKLNEEDRMQYSGNVIYYSKYQTLAAATQYYSGGKISFLPENGEYSLTPTSKTNKSISYMFADKAPFSQLNVDINFICTDNYYHITNFERTVDISMYGMIKVIDNVVLKNNGAKLIGPYEPSFPRDHTSFTSHLPYGAHSINYYDDIGLIRSYEVNANKGVLTFDFKPRYPIHGGWKVSYFLTYLIPIYNNVQYLKEDGMLEFTFPAFGHVLKNVLIEKGKLKILLPEGSSILAAKANEKLVRRGNRRVFSSLSLNGRVQVEFDGRNILDYYNTNVNIRFKHSIYCFIRAPILIIAHLFALFLIVIFTNRYKNFGSY